MHRKLKIRIGDYSLSEEAAKRSINEIRVIIERYCVLLPHTIIVSPGYPVNLNEILSKKTFLTSKTCRIDQSLYKTYDRQIKCLQQLLCHKKAVQDTITRKEIDHICPFIALVPTIEDAYMPLMVCYCYGDTGYELFFYDDICWIMAHHLR